MLKNILPNASIYVIFQLSDNKKYLYFGYLYITKERERKYFCSRHTLSEQDHAQLQNMIQQYNSIR